MKENNEYDNENNEHNGWSEKHNGMSGIIKWCVNEIRHDYN